MEARENVFVQIERRRPNVIYHKACVGTSLAKELYLLNHITCMESLEIELVPSIPLHSMKMGRKGWLGCMFSTSSLCTKAISWWNITKTKIDDINTKFLIKIAKHLWLPLTYSLATIFIFEYDVIVLTSNWVLRSVTRIFFLELFQTKKTLISWRIKLKRNMSYPLAKGSFPYFHWRYTTNSTV